MKKEGDCSFISNILLSNRGICCFLFVSPLSRAPNRAKQAVDVAKKSEVRSPSLLHLFL